MIVGCYGIDLYCRYSSTSGWDKEDDIERHGYFGGMGQFPGPTEAYCKRAARKAGWVFNRDGEVTCPKCAKRR